MDWNDVRRQVAARVRGSRLRIDLRQNGVALAGMSLEDYIHSAVEEFFGQGGEVIQARGESIEEATIRTIYEITVRKADTNRKRHSRHYDLLQKYCISLEETFDQKSDEELVHMILEAVDDDIECKIIAICLLDDMAEYKDSEKISKLTDLTKDQISNAKKRMKRKIKRFFDHYQSGRHGAL